MKRSGFIQTRCSKCGGNVYLDNDNYGWYEQCLQCGNTAYLPELKGDRELVAVSAKRRTGSKNN